MADTLASPRRQRAKKMPMALTVPGMPCDRGTFQFYVASSETLAHKKGPPIRGPNIRADRTKLILCGILSYRHGKNLSPWSVQPDDAARETTKHRSAWLGDSRCFN